MTDMLLFGTGWLQTITAALSQEAGNTPDKLSVHRRVKVWNKQPFRVTFTQGQSTVTITLIP